METWRIIATAVLFVAGVPGVLMVMAKVRDVTGRSGSVAVSGAVSGTGLLLLGVLVLTVLPTALSWSVVGLVCVAVAVLLLAS